MRRPYRYKERHGQPPFIVDAALPTRPNHALKIAMVHGQWSALQANMFGLFGALLGGQDEMAFNIYYRVLAGKERDRDKVFDEVARASGLPKLLFDDVAKLRRDMGGCKKFRNEVAHALWAIKDDMPDGRGTEYLLAVADLREWAENFHATLGWSVEQMSLNTGRVPRPSSATVREYLQFTVDDLEEVAENITLLRSRAGELLKRIASHGIRGALETRPRYNERIARRLLLDHPRHQNTSTEPPNHPLDKP